MWFLLFSIMGFYIISMLVFGTTTFADPIRGYEIMNQYISGAKWNTLIYPSVNHPEFSYFVSWWAPAQWVIPFVFVKLFSVDSFQIIQFFLISICLFISLIGYYKLFRRFDFSLNVILLALICIVTNQLFYWQTFMYYGGDLYFLAILPFYVMCILNLKESQNFRTILLYLFLSFLAVLVKNTGFILLFASLLFLFFTVENKALIGKIKYIIFPFLICFLIYFILDRYYLSLGESPGKSIDYEGYPGVKNDLLGDLTYSLGSPFGIFSRFTFFIQKIYSVFTSNLVYSNTLQVIPFIVTGLFLYKFPKNRFKLYYSCLLFFCIPFLLFFTFLFLQNKAVSYEMRHFASVSFLFFPGIIYWFNTLKFRKILQVLIIGFCLLDSSLYFLSLIKIEKTHSFWNTLKLPNEDVNLLSEIRKWDLSTNNGLLIVEDYWQLSIGGRKNDKLTLKKKNEKYYVVSGMELDSPDQIMLDKRFFKRYSSILLISSKNKPEGIVELKKYKDFRRIKETNRFSIFKSIEH